VLLVRLSLGNQYLTLRDEIGTQYTALTLPMYPARAITLSPGDWLYYVMQFIEDLTEQTALKRFAENQLAAGAGTH